MDDCMQLYVTCNKYRLRYGAIDYCNVDLGLYAVLGGGLSSDIPAR